MQTGISRRLALRGGISFALLTTLSACGAMKGAGSSANDQLMSAAQAGNVAAIQGALADGADVNAFDYAEGRSARTALSYAAIGNHPDAIRVLVAAGAQVNLANNTGFTALHRAAEAGSTEAAQTLLELGADKTLRHGGGFTPSQVAMESGHMELAELLK
jgi:ankyrin repeat protein